MSRKLIVTTSWDDGTVFDLKLAELLAKFDLKGTFYVCQSYSPDPLSPKDIVALDQKFEIGAHSLSHRDLTRIPAAEAREEIQGIKTYLEDILGHSGCLFAYPYGKYNGSVAGIVKDCGFLAARTCEPKGLILPQDPYQWHITLLASNGSPLMTLRILGQLRLWRLGSLLDWESRARAVFDLALKRGGVYHLYGHSARYEISNSWKSLERVFHYISRREGVAYMTNGEIFKPGEG